MSEYKHIIKKQNINLNNYGDYSYTEYPHKSNWDDFNTDQLQNVFRNIINPFLLYLHIPFCKERCLYCLCHTKITKDQKQVKEYLNGLYHEIYLYKKLFKTYNISPLFKRIHIGGGSPSILRLDDFERLINKITAIETARDS